MGDELKVGTKIRLDGKYSGHIRYKGPLEGALHPWPRACACTTWLGCRAHNDGAGDSLTLGPCASSGRKGDWLGLDLEDTVGDNDGTVGGKKYFNTHDVRAPRGSHVTMAAGDTRCLVRRVTGSSCAKMLGA